MKFKNLTKEQLMKLLENNNSLSGVLDDMGIKKNSGNFQTLHRYAKKFEISLDKILNDNSKYIGNKNGTTYDLSEILIIDSSYGNTHRLKIRLYSEGIKERMCEKCGQGEYWNGEYMSLILDHVNGIHTDNRIENLRILCPNCNATLPTHCGKNIGFEKKLKNNINDTKKLTNKRKVERPPYKKLLDEINELGYCGTGRKHGVSDNAIRKWVKFYEKEMKNIDR